MNLPVSFDDVQSAEPVVRRWLPETPLYEYPLLSRLIGCRFWLKHENHQPVGAFKVRGGVNLVSSLGPAERRAGIIAVSTGNHGQSLAWSCRQMGVPSTIVVPEGNNPDKLRAMRAWGARIIEFGRDFDEAKGYCERLAAGELPLPPCGSSGNACSSAAGDVGRPPAAGSGLADPAAQRRRGPLRYVHSANEPKLIAGVGTYALEIFRRLSDPDVIIVPIGLGSGISGTAIVAKHLRPRTQVIGVQAEGAPAVAESWRTGKFVSYERVATRAEGLATRSPAEMTLAIMRKLVDDVVLVSEDQIDQAVRWLLEATHNLAEGAGAASTAAAFKLRRRLAGKRVVAIFSGGNLDLRILPEILARTEPLPRWN